jgi:hypothetical protein
MTDLEGRAQRLLRFYPAGYRAERGPEIVATLLDAAAARGRSSRRDLADLALHGIEMRLGLSPDRFGGRVMDEAALPGLGIGAALAVFFFVWGDWLPILETRRNFGPVVSFGPFFTVGPVIYLVWILAFAAILIWPRWRRAASALCIATAVAMWPIGKLVSASPNFWQLVLLVGVSVPGLLAPTSQVGRSRVPVALAAGALAFAAIWWLGQVHFLALPQAHPNVQVSFYTVGNYLMARNLTWLAGAIFVGVVVLIVGHQVERAGAIAILTAPLLAVVAGSLRGADAVGIRDRGVFVIFGILALIVPIMWLVVMWTIDLRSTRGNQFNSVVDAIGPA